MSKGEEIIYIVIKFHQNHILGKAVDPPVTDR
jgi:hypothetical protein